MKKEIELVNAVPSKRLFLSIMADYDLNRSICELVDNALDIWIKNKKKKQIDINITLEENQQLIIVSDNAGGIKKSELHLIVGPGQTSNEPLEETIGIFGVGTKRAVVFLSQDIKITTRYGTEKTHQVEFDDIWLESENWELPVYEVYDIKEGTNVVELHKLRVSITDEVIARVKKHLQATYARFLYNKKVKITINQDELKPTVFEDWAYPPNYPPHRYITNLKSEDGGEVSLEILGGLTLESSPAGGEYGVYFYCNDRLVARALKTYEVGFMKGLAGQPHPNKSLVRVIVSLKGPAKLMPWNSSKSGINTNHNIFVAIRDFQVQVLKEYAYISSSWSNKKGGEGGWSEKVFKYDKGDIKEIFIENLPKAKKSYLPELPKSRHRYSEKIKQANKEMSSKKPWASGLYEGIIAVDIIFKQKLEHKNRICLILLDSTLEIAFKEYLVNELKEHYSDGKLIKLFNNRNDVENEIKKNTNFDAEVWKQIKYYHNFRNKLIHERITVSLDDSHIENYRGVVQGVLESLFKLNFACD